MTDTRDEIVFDWSNPQFSRAEDLNNISIWFVAYTSAPARRAGNVVLVHETLNMAKEGRKAWTYSPGTRRVRRAPNIAYDNPVTNGDGLGTSDQYDGYNGAPDRYDWTVVGKQEKLSQQNNYNAVLTPYSDLLTANHPNQDVMRYELRRQWVVEANLKGGARHIYAKRVCAWTKTAIRCLVAKCMTDVAKCGAFRKSAKRLISVQRLKHAGPRVVSSPWTFWQAAILVWL